MAYSEAQKRATAKYQTKVYDEIKIRVKKGNKEVIAKYAAEQGKSVNAYIIDLIEKDINK